MTALLADWQIEKEKDELIDRCQHEPNRVRLPGFFHSFIAG